MTGELTIGATVTYRGETWTVVDGPRENYPRGLCVTLEPAGGGRRIVAPIGAVRVER